ncbi:hypothetical protein AWW72_15895 [Acinetobacter sp. NRRL B-65365]|nr:hypothetical protein AWW72_15895 [Acinetobacter sp. NRRL B-65365]
MESNKNVKMCEELLKENNLFEVYIASRKIPFSKTNKFLLLIFSIISIFSTLGIENKEFVEAIPAIASTLLGAVLTVLGFLIAGYTIFCSVLSHNLSMELYNSEDKPFGFSKLKYSHLLFMRVFSYYLIYTFLLFIIVFFCKSTSLSALISLISQHDDCIFLITNYILYNFLFIGISFLLLQLASFIFNIYHTVMTSICSTEINK